jgi:hypothetical protein
MRHSAKNAPGCPTAHATAKTGGGKDGNARTPGRPISASGVSFRASIPPTEQAIKIHGEGGARLLIDIAEDDLPAFLPALAMRGKVLRVTLEEHD